MRITRKPGIFFMLMALAAVLVLALSAACGGGDDDDDNTGDDGGSTTSATATEDTGGDDGGDESATPTEDTGGDDGGLTDEQLSELADRYDTFRGMVTYQITGGTADDALSSMTFWRSDTASRYDITDDTGTTTVIESDALYFCADESCIKYDADNSTGNPFALFTSLFSAEAIQAEFGDLSGIDVEESSDTIAGLDASCFHYSGDLDPDTEGDESGEICFAENGMMLRLASDDAEDFGSFEATEVTTDISDADFEPPYPVTDLSGLGQ